MYLNKLLLHSCNVLLKVRFVSNRIINPLMSKQISREFLVYAKNRIFFGNINKPPKPTYDFF